MYCPSQISDICFGLESWMIGRISTLGYLTLALSVGDYGNCASSLRALTVRELVSPQGPLVHKSEIYREQLDN